MGILRESLFAANQAESLLSSLFKIYIYTKYIHEVYIKHNFRGMDISNEGLYSKNSPSLNRTWHDLKMIINVCFIGILYNKVEYRMGKTVFMEAFKVWTPSFRFPKDARD